MVALGLLLTVLAGPTVPVPLPAPVLARLRSVTVTETDERALGVHAHARRRAVGPAGAPSTSRCWRTRRCSPVRAWCSSSRSAAVRTCCSTASSPRPSSPRRPRRAARRSTVTGRGRLATCSTGGARRRVPRARRLPPGADDPGAVRARRGSCPRWCCRRPTIGPAAADRADPHPARHRPASPAALASRHGYVTYVVPGPVPGIQHLYWGPPVRVGPPQPALSVDLGAADERRLGADLPDRRRRPDAGDRRGRRTRATGRACRCRPGPACARRWPRSRCRR